MTSITETRKLCFWGKRYFFKAKKRIVLILITILCITFFDVQKTVQFSLNCLIV
jgi:hypothetical protein